MKDEFAIIGFSVITLVTLIVLLIIVVSNDCAFRGNFVPSNEYFVKSKGESIGKLYDNCSEENPSDVCEGDLGLKSTTEITKWRKNDQFYFNKKLAMNGPVKYNQEFPEGYFSELTQ